MSAAETTSSIWPVLLPVLVGGLLALLGGIVGPIVGHALSSRSARRNKREQLFERLVQSVYDYDEWLELRKNIVAFGEQRELPPQPLPTAITLAAIYFHEMIPAVKAVSRASADYTIWMASAGQRRLNGDHALLEGFSEAYKPYYKALSDFQNAVEEYARDHADEFI